MVHYWSPEEDAQLKQLYAQNLSCRQIAARMDCGFSRNAIIGRVHRLDLEPRGPRGNGRPVNPNLVKKKRARNRSGEHHVVQKIVARSTMEIMTSRYCGPQRFIQAPTPEYKLRCVEIVQLKLSTIEMDLGKQCQWIEGEDYLHCGQPVKEGSPYCTPHHFICRRAPDERPTGRVSKTSSRVLEVA